MCRVFGSLLDDVVDHGLDEGIDVAGQVALDLFFLLLHRSNLMLIFIHGIILIMNIYSSQ